MKVDPTSSPVATNSPAPLSSGVTVASAESVKDLMKIERLTGSAPGEWTLTDRECTFDRVASSPKGGFVVLGSEKQNSPGHFLFRLADDGTPRWVLRFSRGGDVVPPDLAVDDSGTIALLAQHTGGLSVGEREIVHGEERAIALSLMLVGDGGELKSAISQKREALDFSRGIVAVGGFVTSSLDLLQAYESPASGLLRLGDDGQEVRREITGPGFQPKFLAGGIGLGAVGKQEGILRLGGRTVAPAPARGLSAWVVASLSADLGLRWAHPLNDARFREPTAVAQDERGHVFAAFRYGASHGFTDDPFAAAVYELDERGHEVHHFSYGPSATISHLFPAPDGLTIVGFSWQPEVQLNGHPLTWPLGESSHDEYPAFLLRVDVEGKPVAQREYRERDANVWTPAHQIALADVASAGPGFLAAVGHLGPNMPFAGLRLAQGEPDRAYIARIRRP